MQWNLLQNKDESIYRKMITFFLIVPFAMILSMKNYNMYYFVIELLSIVICLMIFLTVINSYSKSTEDHVAFLGITTASIIGFQILNIITHEGLNIFTSEIQIHSSYLLIIKRALYAIGLLSMLAILNNKRRYHFITVIYSIAFFLFATLIFDPRIINIVIENTYFIGGTSLIIIALLVISIMLLFKSKKLHKEYFYTYIGMALYAAIFSEVFYLLSNNASNGYDILAHLLQLASIYLIYNAVINTSFNKSFIETNKELIDKLSQTNDELEKEVFIRKQSENNLKNSKNKYQKLIALLPDAVFIHDANKFFYTNPKGADLLGLKNPDEIIDKNIYDFIDDGFHQSFKANIEEVSVSNSITSRGEQRLIRTDKQFVDIEIAAMSVFELDEGLILSVVRDISERKRTKNLEKQIENAIEHDKIKTEFFANLSHEMKTPINLIYSTIQLLELDDNMSTPNNKLNKKLKILKQNCNRITRLVDNLIDITKIDADYFQLELHNIDIIAIIRNITLSVAEHVKNKSINIRFQSEVEQRIMTIDPNAIERIILNLLSNAVKFTEPGDEICVFVNDNGKNLQIVVKDTGIGIPKDKLDVIFDRFTQIDKSLTRNHEGSGIGLSIVKSLIELHEGTIRVDSVLDKGTEFIVELPIKCRTDKSIIIEEYNFDRSIDKVKVEFSDIYSLGA
ncbi:sensor histidine kinase [Alkaliphilus peptidifermentans]|uniref:histidine kinase n=1 Tax=Alkaliphilus peptidifermentans DSM 18978 TaxID=1120976 RepID=A0A1G5HPI8_9FIRM|nr:MASE3 domain-containing protein [Alkaliphilus peptidifermentans]SCY65230.1 PAS domain S-box-containing protein [Alkaliphilus peptidifermentans DSM 18978]